MNTFHLLKTRRFLPLFLTQFLGAFNDNVYKNALLIMIMYQGTQLYSLDANQLVTFSAGIFILPFLLFSALAGQLADKYEKSLLIQKIKLLEIVIMSLAILGFYFQHVLSLIILLFLMGTQSALFGPVKYGILPQHLRENELVSGNGFIEMGTFLAILLGTILGGIVIAIKPYGSLMIAFLVVFFALLGWLSSRAIPTAQPPAPQLVLNWNLVVSTWHMMSYIKENRSILIATLGNAWFWFVGATFLSQFPAYSKTILLGDEHIVTLLLFMFSIGIGIGSTSCDILSRRTSSVGLVPLGAIGISLFAIDVYFASQYFTTVAIETQPIHLQQFFSYGFATWRLLIDLILIGIFGGFYIVPLYVILQQRSQPEHRSRLIAANNVLSALLMVTSSLVTVLLLKFSITIPQIFLIIGISNIIITSLLFINMKEFIEQFILWFRSMVK